MNKSERFERERMPVVAPGLVRFRRIVPFLCIDSSWMVRWKWLWDCFAGEHGDYTGYVTYEPGCDWQEWADSVGVLHIENQAQQAQYFPTYAGDIIGSVDDVIVLMDLDGVADDEIRAVIKRSDGSLFADYVAVRNLYNKDFESVRGECPIVFSRPMVYVFEGMGNICDNAEQAFFCRVEDVCDGTPGLREADGTYDEMFWADYLRFYRSMFAGDFERYLPEDVDRRRIMDWHPVLVLYVVGAGSVPRIRINGSWKIISPEYFPSYGDPYGFVYRGYKARVLDHDLRFGVDEVNEFEIEHVAPTADDIGCQVIMCLELDVDPGMRRRVVDEGRRMKIEHA